MMILLKMRSIYNLLLFTIYLLYIILVESRGQLEELGELLNNVDEFAFDVEGHSYRSYYGQGL